MARKKAPASATDKYQAQIDAHGHDNVTHRTYSIKKVMEKIERGEAKTVKQRLALSKELGRYHSELVKTKQSRMNVQKDLEKVLKTNRDLFNKAKRITKGTSRALGEEFKAAMRELDHSGLDRDIKQSKELEEKLTVEMGARE
jgi:hypothetical protein